jgi:hypothetical protein
LAIGLPIYLESRKPHQPEPIAPVVPTAPTPAAVEE